MTFNWTLVNNPVDVLVGVNYEAQGLIGAGILILIWFLIYLLHGGEPTREKMVVASFVSGVSAIFMRLLCDQGYCMASDTHLGIALVLFIGSLALLINRD